MSDRRLDGVALRDWAHACVGDLIRHTDEINRLNVFPVADSDTGTNMLFTMRSAVAACDVAGDRTAVDEVMSVLAAGALDGARGNSGVILSQILRGFAEVTAEAVAHRQLSALDAEVFGAGLRRGVATVVAAMGGEAIDGTIVSVLAAAADAAERSAVDGDPLPTTVHAAATAAAAALDATPSQLAVLAEAGVVDAGGRGLLVLLDALSATLTGTAPVRPVYRPQAAADPAAKPTELSTAPAFEVMYTVAGLAPDAESTLRGRLEQLGDSVVIATAGEHSDHSVHVHTDDAGAAVEAGLDHGSVSQIRISVLSAGQHVAPAGWSRERTILAVVDGDGSAALFEAEGATILRCHDDPLDGCISAHRLLRAVVDTGAAKVMVLPNGYVAVEELVAACTAAIGWGIDVVPLPTGSMVQGLAALAVHDPDRQAVDDGYAMAQASGATRYGSVRLATEDALTWVGPCHRGDGLGIAGDEVLVVRHDITAAARGLIDLMLGAGGELVTVLLGDGVDQRVGELLAEHVGRHHLGAELVSYRSGHRGDAVLIGVE
ncbi:dihydroxyacetone kinase [Mycolicibacterium insubricum]|uniref:Dihydroxyacetone kinase n=1 Tax=Mycolicibacterium insubricum TaxID=444597 RepID=A0A1X0DJ17_9MYCO|nr:DAK2 domain-containing protein [Mycolicibacterium insubricum]MCB9439991.1 DAK2 domain-containing protein [Mycolicibacterium sp.]ORA72192.1 dihydroxyacetone kinase [Mycolicibacterium insubricum]BBZ66582.1 dihydroxyacetone kinase [Mycolicibacterium insubricum]